MADNFYGEYSKLRSIARKRAERLTKAGLSDLITFPTVKELKAQGISPVKAIKNVESYLSSPTTIREYKKLGEADRPAFIKTTLGAIVTSKDGEKQIRQKVKRQERNRRYREKVKSLTKHEKSLVKAAKTLGLHITPSNAKAFAEYMDFRFAQGGDSVHYQVARYVEDYMSLVAKKRYKPDEILKDFNLFLSDRIKLQERELEMRGVTGKYIDELFEEFIEEDY